MTHLTVCITSLILLCLHEETGIGDDSPYGMYTTSLILLCLHEETGIGDDSPYGMYTTSLIRVYTRRDGYRR